MANTEVSPRNTTDFGEFVKDEEEELDLEELVEPWYRYETEDNQNVLYPIRLGEVLNERYLVEHKLGFGGGSTVWMAFDMQDKRDVALKIMALGKWGDNETRIQDKIIKTVQDTPRLVIYTATFFLPRDDKSYHRVLVFPIKGPSICTLTLKMTPMGSRMSAARQLLETVASLHKAGIIHRDLNAGNCMWGMAPIDRLSRSAKYKLLGRPLKQTIPFVDLWKKGELVSPVKVPKELLRTEEFYLCDFGLAKKVGDLTAQRGYPPMHYCSPDRLHGQEPSFACDIWSYMAIFSMLYLTFPPFPTFLEGGVVSDMVECLGPLPEQWKGLYTHPGGLDSWYDHSQTPDLDNDLAAKIAYFRPDADLVERQHVQSIMSKVFVYHPEKRPTAIELLHDPSFRAIMDRYGC
ncbi:putative serine/threonine-protein kinase clkA [Penicillium chrysogenum]|uniref:Pc16g07130 protein n=2 Tax=Penicillium chrysogenum species complex TaxID=254878 RepID=B6H7D5_PENRW|nr:putative serine/threonine-protein kinase clkA [Penicillium chrysogenum]CAP93383.1 Pc16g07130 [Penicillium rubens Wisconsin 54-1255]